MFSASFFHFGLNFFPQKNQIAFQRPATTMMEGIIDLHHDIFSFLVLIVVFVSLMLLSILVTSLQTKPQDIRFMQFHTGHGVTHHTMLETVWTAVPTVILLFISIPSFALIYALDEIVEPQLTVRVVGRQWYWTYEFPDTMTISQCDNNNESVWNMTVPGFSYDSYIVNTEDLPIGSLRLLEVNRRLVLPQNTNIRLLVTSYDVIHSWAVPAFGVKVDALPGRLNEYFVNLDYLGTFYGQCSEICGVNHGFMPIAIKAVPMNLYNFWVDFNLSK